MRGEEKVEEEKRERENNNINKKGLFESGDAKDQESTSEEINYHFGVKMWAMVNKRTELQDLADLMLAVSIRSINTYFLMDKENVAHPKEFIGNKVTGIFFENKAHYTTWFSPRVECIHGIQMIPMISVSEDVRKVKFVEEEWELLKDIAPNIADAWASIIYTNYVSLFLSFPFFFLFKKGSQFFLHSIRRWLFTLELTFSCLLFKNFLIFQNKNMHIRPSLTRTQPLRN